eukprot:CAMPEP_0173250960 /NCGR_PEP_ID=MMETSP1142-20121109/19875_1 /TAXON_ID=483371 /ORGANISM="non described non described, Strain CCMP2298" /LENGTH=41 /DNA_ID= /DNA_START= /DNA_END= /DNA_ORIENTATION=
MTANSDLVLSVMTLSRYSCATCACSLPSICIIPCPPICIPA